MLQNFSTKTQRKLRGLKLDVHADNGDDAPNVAEYINIKNRIDFIESNAPPSSNLFGMRRRYQELPTTDGLDSLILIKILASVFVDSSAQATDPRDRIFAMLGMASDQTELGLKPNYNELLTETDVFTQTARAIIRAGYIDLLSLSQHASQEQNDGHIPSWVPHWRNPISLPGVGLPWDIVFAASGDTSFKKPLDSTALLPNQISLRGWILDEIEKLSPVRLESNKHIIKNRENIKNLVCEIIDLCSASDAKFQQTGCDIYASITDTTSAFRLIPIAGLELNSMGFIQQAGERSVAAFPILIDQLMTTVTRELTQDRKLQGSMYMEAMWRQKSRRPFLSNSGYVGLAPSLAEEGDVLVIFSEAEFPYVLRRNANGTYSFVGDAYVHVVMYGEFMASARETETFVLE